MKKQNIYRGGPVLNGRQLFKAICLMHNLMHLKPRRGWVDEMKLKTIKIAISIAGLREGVYKKFGIGSHGISYVLNLRGIKNKKPHGYKLERWKKAHRQHK